MNRADLEPVQTRLRQT